MHWDLVIEDLRGFRWQYLSPSAKVLLASNVLTIISAIFFGLDPAEVIWVYWFESVVIGAYTILAFIMMARRPKSAREEGTPAGAYGYAIFFAIHYGMFHLVYAVFLFALPWFNITHPDFIGMGVTLGILALSHGYSFRTNVLQDPSELARTKENMDRVMYAPYSRIIPMHLTIIFSGFLMLPLQFLEVIAGAIWSGPGLAAVDWLMKFVTLLLFMGLKTSADLYSHVSRYQ